MYLASVNTDPDELVFATRSLPAKSTRWSFDRRILSELTFFDSKDIENMQCERDDA